MTDCVTGHPGTDILFGVVWKETGVKRFYLRNRQRVISFAVTIVFKKYDQRYVTSCLTNVTSSHSHPGILTNVCVFLDVAFWILLLRRHDESTYLTLINVVNLFRLHYAVNI